MNAVSPTLLFSGDLKPLEHKAQAVRRALMDRYSGQISTDELNHLHALYILGLTTPFFGHRKPDTHLEACRALLLLSLTPEEAERVLSTPPQACVAWLERAFLTIEQLGIRDGRALGDQLPKPETVGTETERNAAMPNSGEAHNG